MTKIRDQQYDLTCKIGEYEALLKSLNLIASGHFPTDERGWTTYVVSSENIELSLMDKRKKILNGLEGTVLMAVKRTPLKEPEFVRQIVQRLHGKPTSSGVYTNKYFINLCLKDSYKKFQNKKE